MRKTIYLFFALAALASCKKYLDKVPDDKLSGDDIFQSWTTAQRFLANVYSHIPDEFGQRDGGKYSSSDSYNSGGIWTGGSDEAEFLWGFVRSNNLNIGAWDATAEFVRTYWTNYYQGIQGASTFIANADQIGDLDQNLKNRYKAEARALRAIYYYQLLRIYGPVVLMGEKPVEPTANLQMPRNSVEEVVDFISSELTAAANDLPVTPTDDLNYGRVTRGMALAYKAQALLVAASPLFNGNADYANLKNKDGKQLISQSNDANKWKTAADAYKAFITEFVPGTYDLYKEYDGSTYNAYKSCRNVTLVDWNREVILARSGSVNSRQYELCPRHDGAASNDVKGGTGLAATQQMVDAFFMANGQSPVLGYNADGSPIVNAASGYQLSGFTDFKAPSTNATLGSKSIYNQWVNREPRFYVNITYNRSNWLNPTYPVETTLYRGGNSGKKADGTGGDYSVTGYGVRKSMSTGKWDNSTDHKLVLLRLAEIYLGYAEALNEDNYAGNLNETLKYLNLIRERAGIPQYGVGSDGLAIPASQEEMRQAIRKERRVELAFENSRFFDVRRWKIAETTENGKMYGLDIDATTESGFYTVKSFETRVFNKKHYLFPLPQEEINNDVELVQNTGW
ncbi:MAG: RagB/SusD family nutrient uptake outer membrane protein [Candidatus Pseudobacter hemicellulosilyticus]|uniref:RagB/SusD family nutrient uptake outer membrane protein n=1 Tax=Candidatus Pseudobacter hemicellulosilyticus TaxID=3121375 RepID=A0AAJ5WNH2_9BACT|nr:MAG: RagB/SusD family nutrient uptake outer membrane protein [Pseudobacter sp.]